MTSTLDLGSNYTLEESSNGNLLIKDSTGTVVLKHTDGADFSLGAALELGDLVDGSTGDTVYDGSTETLGDGTQAADLQSVNTSNLGIVDTLINSGLAYGTTVAATPDSDPSDTSSSTFETIASFSGGIGAVDEVPAGATLQANLIVQADSVPNGETGTYRAQLLDRAIDGGDGSRTPTELEVQVSDTTNQESGWQDISGEFINDGPIQVSSFQAKISSGTLATASADRQILLLRWVVD